MASGDAWIADGDGRAYGWVWVGMSHCEWLSITMTGLSTNPLAQVQPLSTKVHQHHWLKSSCRPLQIMEPVSRNTSRRTCAGSPLRNHLLACSLPQSILDCNLAEPGQPGQWSFAPPSHLPHNDHMSETWIKQQKVSSLSHRRHFEHVGHKVALIVPAFHRGCFTCKQPAGMAYVALKHLHGMMLEGRSSFINLCLLSASSKCFANVNCTFLKSTTFPGWQGSFSMAYFNNLLHAAVPPAESPKKFWTFSASFLLCTLSAHMLHFLNSLASSGVNPSHLSLTSCSHLQSIASSLARFSSAKSQSRSISDNQQQVP